MSSRSWQHFCDSLYIGLLVLYVLGGVWLTPFHGDESTIMYMSRDWDALTSGLQSVFFTPNPPDGQLREDQELRLLNGTVSKYLIGLGWWLSGMHVDDLPGSWAWGLDWWENRYYGHLPGAPILFVARMTSALTAALSVAVVFAVARRLAGRGPAWLAALVYTTMPAVLLNGRRAMFDGAQLLATALVILAGIGVVHFAKQHDSRSLLKRWLLLGAAAGFALASKHSTIIVIVPVMGTLLVLSWRSLWRAVAYSLVALFIAAGVFLLLNPAWWSAPLQMPAYVLELRRDMMTVQTSFYDELADPIRRITKPVRFLLGPPQYAEDAKFDWEAWIGDQIVAYEGSGLAGINWYNLGLIGWLLPAVGLLIHFSARRPANVVFLGAASFSTVAILMTNTLPWQRYYLPLAACLAILLGTGAYGVFRVVRTYARQFRSPGDRLPKLAS